MIKLILVLIFMFNTSLVYANVELGLSYSLSTTNNLENRADFDNLYGIQLMYDWADFNLGFESSFLASSESQEGLASMSKKYFEEMLWVRYNFVKTNKIDIFFGIGSGIYWEDIKISILDSSYSESTKFHSILSGALGFKYKLLSRLNTSVEYRVIRKVAAEIQDYSVRTSLNFIF